MNRLAIELLAAVAFTLMGFVIGGRVVDSHLTALHKAELARINADNANALASLQAKARASEQQHAQQLADIDKQHQKDIQHEISSRDAVIADLRSGAVRLRKRFTCAAAGDQRVQQSTTSTGSGDAASAGGLQTADAEFLIRLASRADEVALQLQACQAVVRSDRQVQP